METRSCKKRTGDGRPCTPASAHSPRSVATACLVLVQLALASAQQHSDTASAPFLARRQQRRMAGSASAPWPDDVSFNSASLMLRQFPQTVPLVFLHVPKTGGTSTSAYFHDKWGTHCQMANLQDPAAVELLPQVAKGTHENASCHYAHLEAGHLFDGRKVLLELIAQRGVQLHFLMGHLPFGYCQLLPRGCLYISLLRDPVRRLVSHYHHAMLPDTAKQVLESCPDCTTLAGFLRTFLSGSTCFDAGPLYGMDNMQVRMLAGDGFWASLTRHNVCAANLGACDVVPSGRVDGAMLAAAKRNILASIPVVGILEDQGRFLDVMEHMFNYSRHGFGHLNSRPEAAAGAEVGGPGGSGGGGGGGGSVLAARRLEESTVPEEVWAQVDHALRYDVELYRFARQRLRMQHAAIGLGATIGLG